MLEKIKVIFEDRDILVVNKPAGLIVNRAKTVKGETLQGWFFGRQEDRKTERLEDWGKLLPEDFDNQYGEPEEIFEQRNGLVHRLDKYTSGVMVLAKNPGSLVNLLSQFKKREVKKRYICLVHGELSVESGEVNVPIARSKNNNKKFAVVLNGRSAITEYKVLQFYQKQGYQQGFSLVECLPKTGRTHQIRVHMTHLQHPLVGDKKYLGKKRARLDEQWCPRQFLHASFLEFTHPRTKKRVSFEAELSEDLKKALSLLE
jgi:23S rRNA pseudouridine1911/1915/1917 synthase